MSDAFFKSIEFVEKFLRESINLDDIASSSHVSTRQLQRYYRELVRGSVKQYLRDRRLAEATKDLVLSQRRITDIAFDYQFNSVESFSRAFYRSYGCLPSIYRKIGNEYSPAQQYPLSEESVQLLQYHQKYSGQFTSLPIMNFIGFKMELANEGEPTIMNTQRRTALMQRVIDHLKHHQLFTRHLVMWEIGYRQPETHAGTNIVFLGVNATELNVNGNAMEGFEYLSIPAGNYIKFYHPHMNVADFPLDQQIHLTNHLAFCSMRDSPLFLDDRPYVASTPIDINVVKPSFELYMPYAKTLPDYKLWW